MADHVPVGYEPDTKTYTTKVVANQTTTVNTTTVKEQPYYGTAKLKKVSANTNITDNNRCYSLKGAVYGVYKSEAGAKNGETPYKTMTTDESGNATLEKIPLG